MANEEVSETPVTTTEANPQPVVADQQPATPNTIDGATPYNPQADIQFIKQAITQIAGFMGQRPSMTPNQAQPLTAVSTATEEKGEDDYE